MAPSETLAIKFKLLSSANIFWSSIIFLSLAVISLLFILLKSNLWHLERIVIGSFWGSVVAKINITLLGGSSNVFKNALTAPADNICTSSIIYTLYFDSCGGYLTSSIISLILSTPLFEAASNSVTSIAKPSFIFLHISHLLHGSPSFKLRQFKAFAKSFAVEVLPVPLVPQKRYAWAILLFNIWFFKVVVICSCPTTSLNVLGLHSLYKAVYVNTITSFLVVFSINYYNQIILIVKYFSRFPNSCFSFVSFYRIYLFFIMHILCIFLQSLKLSFNFTNSLKFLFVIFLTFPHAFLALYCYFFNL